MSNNPLKQYFRRPAVYIKLPSGGKGYPEGAIDMPENGELPVYPMTAIDEITSRTPDALFNGTAVVEIIKSCVPNMKDPWSISAMDMDTILVAIRTAASPGDLEIESSCPKCSNEGKYGLNLGAVLSSMKAANYDQELDVNDLKIKFKPIMFREINDAGMAQFEIQKTFAKMNSIEDEEERVKLSQAALQSITDLTMKIVTKGIEYIKTPTTTVTNREFILDFLRNCDKTTYTTIRDHSTELKVQSEIKPLNITCVECGNNYEQAISLSPSDFFG